MHKIDTDTAVGDEFVDGNEAASIKATRLNAKWFNTIQRELCNIVTKAGMALSENDDGQVLAAILLHAIDEILGGKSHYGTLKLAGESGVNAVLREYGIWFEYPDGVHVFVSEDGFGYHYVDVNGDTVEVKLNKYGLFLGDAIQIINGLSILKSLVISDILRIDRGGSLIMTGIFSARESGFVVQTDFKVGETVEIQQNGNVRADGSVDADVLSAKKTVNGTAFCASIFDATEQSVLLNPGSLLGAVALAGATALVRNATGGDVVISRSTVSTSDRMVLIVRHGEILRYVYDGSKWVHSW